MSERWVLRLLIGLPIVLLSLMGFVICAVEGRLDIFFKFMLPIGLATMLVIFGFAAIMLRWLTRGTRTAFDALAEERGGTVIGNFMGEFQLRLPHPRGTFLVDLRNTADTYLQAKTGRAKKWTRLALELPEWHGPDWDRKFTTAGGFEDVPREYLVAMQPLLVLCGDDYWLRVRGQADPATVDVWFGGWITTLEQTRALADVAPGCLSELADAVSNHESAT